MEVKEAVKKAKEYVADIFAEESLTNLGLEEIEYNDTVGAWDVTLGFSRPWNTQRDAFTAITGTPAARRAYRIVRIMDDGAIASIRRRESSDI